MKVSQNHTIVLVVLVCSNVHVNFDTLMFQTNNEKKYSMGNKFACPVEGYLVSVYKYTDGSWARLLMVDLSGTAYND